MCDKVVRQRKNRKKAEAAAAAAAAASEDEAAYDAAKVRTERARRWDHLRKSHELSTCDRCSVRMHKKDVALHGDLCSGVKTDNPFFQSRASTGGLRTAASNGTKPSFASLARFRGRCT